MVPVAPFPSQVDHSSNKNTDKPTIPSEFWKFQASRLAQPDDTKRFRQCAAKRDGLLAIHGGIELLMVYWA